MTPSTNPHPTATRSPRGRRADVAELHGDARADCLAAVYSLLHAKGRERIAARRAAESARPDATNGGGVNDAQ